MATKPWEKHRDTITKLYIKDGRTLEDVRGIMETEYNFEASIRSYRQHFKLWGIGKYNCKKRQHRQGTPAPPWYSLPAPRSISETFDPGSSKVSTCASLPSLGQLPLPAIQSAVSHTQSSPPPDPCIKTENEGGEIGRMDIPMDHSTALHPPQSMPRSWIRSTSSTNPKTLLGLQERAFLLRSSAHNAYTVLDGLSIGPCRPFSAAPPRTLTPGYHEVPPSTVIWYQAYVPPNISGGGAWKPRCLASPLGQSLWQAP